MESYDQWRFEKVTKHRRYIKKSIEQFFSLLKVCKKELIVESDRCRFYNDDTLIGLTFSNLFDFVWNFERKKKLQFS